MMCGRGHRQLGKQKWENQKERVCGKGKGGKGKGKSYQRNLGDRKPVGDAVVNDGICHNWSRGNGYCKYGSNCNFKHEGPKGGKRKAASSTMVASNSSKKKERPNKKRKTTLVMKESKPEKDIDTQEEDG
jgi:hypothetical protein